MGQEAERIYSPLTTGQRNILLWQMEAKPNAFKAAIKGLRAEEPFFRMLQLGDPQNPARADHVDFSNYAPDELKGISFVGVKFVEAILPSPDYIRLLQKAGATLWNCSVKDQSGTGKVTDGSWREPTPIVGSHAKAVLESNTLASWAARK